MQSQEYLQQGLKLARQMHNREKQCLLLVALGSTMIGLSEFDRARHFLLDGLTVARDLQDP